MRHRCQAMDGEGFACNRTACGRFSFHGDSELDNWIAWVWIWLCERCATKTGYELPKDKNKYPIKKATPEAKARIKNILANCPDRYPIFGGKP